MPDRRRLAGDAVCKAVEEVIGVVDIGGTKMLAAASEDGVSYTNLVRRETPTAGPEQALINLLNDACGTSTLDAITMSLPGPMRRHPPGLVNPPALSLAWHEMNFDAVLGQHFGCRVVAENDANCSALAEAVQGAGRGCNAVVYFTVSTGIGTGVVRNGEIVINRHDTEGGHMVLWPQWAGGPPCHCGGYGCLETLASGRAIERRFGRRAESLTDQSAWDEIGRWLGLAVVNATSVLDPEVVVLGGGVTRSWDRFAPSLQDTVTAYLHFQPAPKIRKAELADGHNNLAGALLNLVTRAS
jgi:predicted NBD/HSP70 family sugar kinase